MTKRLPVFYISDGTGLTAQALGRSLLTQFESIEFNQISMPFVDSVEKAQECVIRIRQAALVSEKRPIVFSTLVKPEEVEVIRQADALLFDFFETFIAPIEQELGQLSTHTVGRSHSAAAVETYTARIDAVNFSMAHDDGASVKDMHQADLILIGVSRSGKTPTSLYMALQFGVKAANYPLIPEDFERGELPKTLQPFRDKLYGLTINAERLQQIRQMHGRSPSR